MSQTGSIVSNKWRLIGTVGEGAYGKVKLGIDVRTDEKVAVKMVRKIPQGESEARIEERVRQIKREVHITKMFSHRHIVRLIEYEETSRTFRIVLEYVGGGELFERIEPEVGLAEDEAHFLFRQLLAGIEEVHRLGVCHRDLKPENLLLDEFGNLKITDFGLSTLYRSKDRERLLKTKCGTAPYVAPEVLRERYRGPAADIWSCGIILFVMLTGSLPWNEPSPRDQDFCLLQAGKLHKTYPWKNMPRGALDLCMRILTIDWRHRPGIEQIRRHPWFRRKTEILRRAGPDGFFSLESPGLRQRVTPLDRSTEEEEAEPMDVVVEDGKGIMFAQEVAFASQQPIWMSAGSSEAEPQWSSQPMGHTATFMSQVVAYASGTQYSQYSQASGYSRGVKLYKNLVQRMTRFDSLLELQPLMTALLRALKEEGVEVAPVKSYKVRVRWLDVRNKPIWVTIRILLVRPGRNTVVFRRAKGDTIEFKRFFLKIRKQMNEFVI